MLSWLFVLLAAAGGADLFPRGLGPIHAGAADKLRAHACVGCHMDVHVDWGQSRHAKAWTNAIFQREYRDRPLDWCVHCHAPLAEQLAEVKRGGGALADEGVNCAVCHIRGGRVLARRKGPASPHDTDVRADYGGPAFCAGCHQFNFPVIAPDPTGKGPGRVTGYTEHPMQDTVAQHARGPHAKKECLGCHHAGATGHLFPGGHDGDMLSHAIRMDACRDSKGLVVSLANTGAGHNVPTGDLHRHLVLRAWRAGAPEELQEVTLGRRFEPAPEGGKRTTADTTIPPGQTRRVKMAIAPAPEPISLELRLVYTIDEFPFKGRELGEPTYSTMITRELAWKAIRRCSARETAYKP